MRLSAMTWNHYRSFKERHRVEFAPITIIIGRNGSGKSVISRLPLLLSSAVSRDPDGPLDLMAGDVEHAGAYQDLVNMRGALPFSLGIEVSGGEGKFGFETTLRHVSETRSLAIERVVICKEDHEVLAAEIADEDQLTAHEPSYALRVDGAFRQVKPIMFSGLLPDPSSFDNSLGERVRTIVGYFRAALPQPSYLGPFRVEPVRSARSPRQVIRSLGPRGERTVELLADDKLRHGGELGQRVSQWFTDALGQGISIDISGNEPQLLVRDRATALDVGLADTGTGFAQALPIVVQHFAYRGGRLKSPILIVEQPELHLHPAAHGNMADLVVETSRTDGRPTCIVETHSEQFIMRVRRRIAEGLPEGQAVLWSLNHAESRDDEEVTEPLRVIRFDSSGDPNAWPVGVFEEALQDLSQMRQATRGRKL
jgi:hypothetical protein